MATASSKPKASTYSVKMELRDGKPTFSIPKKHRDAFEDAVARASQYAGLGMSTMSEDAKAAAEAINKLLTHFPQTAPAS